jgi:hypothetical protein
MQKIFYTCGDFNGTVEWAESEAFGALRGTEHTLKNLTAVGIMKLNEFTEIERLLLSAVAGAVWQELLLRGVSPISILGANINIAQEGE